MGDNEIFAMYLNETIILHVSSVVQRSVGETSTYRYLGWGGGRILKFGLEFCSMLRGV